MPHQVNPEVPSQLDDYAPNTSYLGSNSSLSNPLGDDLNGWQWQLGDNLTSHPCFLECNTFEGNRGGLDAYLPNLELCKRTCFVSGGDGERAGCISDFTDSKNEIDNKVRDCMEIADRNNNETQLRCSDDQKTCRHNCFDGDQSETSINACLKSCNRSYRICQERSYTTYPEEISDCYDGFKDTRRAAVTAVNHCFQDIVGGSNLAIEEMDEQYSNAWDNEDADNAGGIFHFMLNKYPTRLKEYEKIKYDAVIKADDCGMSARDTPGRTACAKEYFETIYKAYSEFNEEARSPMIYFLRDHKRQTKWFPHSVHDECWDLPFPYDMQDVIGGWNCIMNHYAPTACHVIAMQEDQGGFIWTKEAYTGLNYIAFPINWHGNGITGTIMPYPNWEDILNAFDVGDWDTMTAEVSSGATQSASDLITCLSLTGYNACAVNCMKDRVVGLAGCGYPEDFSCQGTVMGDYEDCMFVCEDDIEGENPQVCGTDYMVDRREIVQTARDCFTSAASSLNSCRDGCSTSAPCTNETLGDISCGTGHDVYTDPNPQLAQHDVDCHMGCCSDCDSSYEQDIETCYNSFRSSIIPICEELVGEDAHASCANTAYNDYMVGVTNCKDTCMTPWTVTLSEYMTCDEDPETGECPPYGTGVYYIDNDPTGACITDCNTDWDETLNASMKACADDNVETACGKCGGVMFNLGHMGANGFFNTFYNDTTDTTFRVDRGTPNPRTLNPSASRLFL